MIPSLQRRSLILGLGALALAPAPGFAAVSADPSDMPGGTWALDRQHASVSFRVQHMGVSFYVARFNQMDATLTWDPRNPTASRLTASVDVTTMDVGADYSRRFADQFLDAGHFPRATFTSTALTRSGPNRGQMTGDLTLRGQTRPVTFDVAFNGVGPGLIPLTARAGFTATGSIRRSDFGSTFLQNIVADDVAVAIEAEFARR